MQFSGKERTSHSSVDECPQHAASRNHEGIATANLSFIFVCVDADRAQQMFA